MLLTNNKWPTIYLATHFNKPRSNKHKNQSWVPVSSTYKLSYCQIRNPGSNPAYTKNRFDELDICQKKKKQQQQKPNMISLIPSKYMKTPSFRRQGLRWRTMTAGRTFLRKSGLPFLTVAMTMSPTQAEGKRLSLPLIPLTDMM